MTIFAGVSFETRVHSNNMNPLLPRLSTVVRYYSPEKKYFIYRIICAHLIYKYIYTTRQYESRKLIIPTVNMKCWANTRQDTYTTKSVIVRKQVWHVDGRHELVDPRRWHRGQAFQGKKAYGTPVVLHGGPAALRPLTSATSTIALLGQSGHCPTSTRWR